MAVRAAAREEKKKLAATKKLVLRAKSKGKEIEVISLEEELEEFHLSGGDGYQTWIKRLVILQGWRKRRGIHL